MSEGAILELKRRALSAKNAGDIDEARRLLAEAKGLTASEAKSAADFKRLAVQLKRQGDIDGAREALGKAKQLEKMAQLQNQSAGESTSSEMIPDPQPPTPTPTPAYEDPVNKAMDEATLDEITGGSKVQFSDEEMLDVETMADMASSGIAIPSEDIYKERSLAWKKGALQAKNKGDIATAKKLLGKAKEFEAAIEKLFRADESALDAMMDDDEDYTLLDELMGDSQRDSQDDDLFEDMFGSTSNVVELDDLDDLDPSMLKDMMESGMEVPDVNEVQRKAQEKKALALDFKKQGNLVAAKGALEESKRLQSKAAQLAEMLRTIESGGTGNDQNMDPDAMFEAMMKASEAPAPKAKPETVAPKTTKEPLKSSHEYKVDAVRLKKENKMQEAAAMLRLYKEALAAETSAAELAKKKDYAEKLQKEIAVTEKQLGLFRFYETFVDRSIGSKQSALWNQYQKSCKAALEATQRGGGELPDLKRTAEHGLLQLVANDLSFVHEACDTTDPRIEVALMDAISLNENKHMKKIIEDPKRAKTSQSDCIRVTVTVQLPPSPEKPDDFVEQTFDTKASSDGFCTFEESTFFVDAARGTSRFAKLLARRLQRRRVTFDVYHVSEKKGLLSRSSNKVLLGSAVLELKDLLANQYIAGEFPLLDVTRRHESGGYLRVAVRSGAPFTEEPVKKNSEAVAQTGMSQTGASVKPFPVFSLS